MCRLTHDGFVAFKILLGDLAGAQFDFCLVQFAVKHDLLVLQQPDPVVGLLRQVRLACHLRAQRRDFVLQALHQLQQNNTTLQYVLVHYTLYFVFMRGNQSEI